MKTAIAILMLSASTLTFADSNAVNFNANDASSLSKSGAMGNITSFNYSNPDKTKVEYSGTQTLRTAPQVYAPPIGVTAPCYVALSGGLSVVGFGIAAGGSIEDEGCTMRETARLLFGIGQPLAAAKVMCNNPLAAEALGEVCAKPVAKEEKSPEAKVVPQKEEKVAVKSNIQCISDPNLAMAHNKPLCN